MEPLIENYIRAFYLDPDDLSEWLLIHQVNLLILMFKIMIFLVILYRPPNTKAYQDRPQKAIFSSVIKL